VNCPKVVGMSGVEIPGAKALEPLNPENAVIFVREGKVVAYILGGTHVFKSGEGEFIEIGQGSEPGTTDAKGLFVKSPTDSGASIGSSFESDAAGVGSSTAKGIAEIFAFAGGEIKTVIDKAGKSSFVQLPTNSKLKLTTGSLTVEMKAAETTTPYVKVNHGLGVKPTAVIPAVNSESLEPGVGGMSAETKNANEISFEVRGMRPFGAPGKNIKFIVGWIAVG
jgi:hypothetical protein